MPRADVREEWAERCLGHKLKGVKGVYNRYEYLFEKRDAFARLGALVDKIVKPRKGNVVQFAGKRRARAN
jgi:hypothetical protein